MSTGAPVGQINISPHRRVRKLWLAAYIVLASLIVSFVPEYFPVKPSVSDSYLFGYNNRVGTALFLLLTALAAILFSDLPIVPKASPHRIRVSRISLYAVLLAVLAVCSSLYAITHASNGFGESAYLINRVQHAHSGGVVYRDFEFLYGPALIYIPAWLMKLGMGATSAYYLFWTLNALVGCTLLYMSINMVDVPSEKKTEAFVLLASFSIPQLLTNGVSYTFLRFAALPFFALLIYRSLRGKARQQSLFLPASLLVVFTGVLFLISPDIAIALALGSSLYLAV